MRTVAAYATMAALTITFGLVVIAATVVGIRPKPNGFLERIPRLWARAVLRASGVTVRVHNPEQIAHGEARVYVANHVSWFDIFALASVLPRYRFVAKKELKRIPIFGIAAGRVAAIYIDRKNRKAAFEGYREATGEMEGDISVVVCPEGTRGFSYELRPFKKGPFVLAIAAQAPVVPCVVYGAREIQPKNAVRIKPGVIDITLLEPIATAGLDYEDRDRLVRTCWKRMADLLESRYGVRSGGDAIDPQPSAA